MQDAPVSLSTPLREDSPSTLQSLGQAVVVRDSGLEEDSSLPVAEPSAELQEQLHEVLLLIVVAIILVFIFFLISVRCCSTLREQHIGTLIRTKDGDSSSEEDGVVFYSKKCALSSSNVRPAPRPKRHQKGVSCNNGLHRAYVSDRARSNRASSALPSHSCAIDSDDDDQRQQF